jgi:hypothetical protein
MKEFSGQAVRLAKQKISDSPLNLSSICDLIAAYRGNPFKVMGKQMTSTQYYNAIFARARLSDVASVPE